MAVLPSLERETDFPCREGFIAPLPTNFGPCCVDCASANGIKRNTAQKTVNGDRELGVFTLWRTGKVGVKIVIWFGSCRLLVFSLSSQPQ